MSIPNMEHRPETIPSVSRMQTVEEHPSTDEARVSVRRAGGFVLTA